MSVFLRRYITTTLLIVVIGVLAFGPVSASQTTPPPYTHSWYVVNPSDTAMDSLGYHDGLWDTQYGVDGMVVLDFGQPTQESGTTEYGGYGVYYFDAAHGYPYMSDAQVVAAAKAYAGGWYRATGSTPRLKLVIGANNYHMCPYGGTCTRTEAGRQWGNVVKAVQDWLVSTGRSWQITAWVGSDMEQPSGGESWDCATETRQFVDGFNGNNPSSARFINYGTAWVPNQCWTVADVHYVSWGATYNWPLPEIYTQYARDSWVEVRRYAYLDFLGVMAECDGADPLPSGDCLAGGSYQYSPTKAWNELWNALANAGFPETSLDYATNIHFQ